VYRVLHRLNASGAKDAEGEDGAGEAEEVESEEEITYR
jgi:hypothetical protein